jgi:hypothetical protein
MGFLVEKSGRRSDVWGGAKPELPGAGSSAGICRARASAAGELDQRQLPFAGFEVGVEAVVVLATGGTALQVLAKARHGDVGISSGELEIDVAVEAFEALLAGHLGFRRPEQAREQTDTVDLFAGAHGISLSSSEPM